jgi:GAF domain-containing protein
VTPANRERLAYIAELGIVGRAPDTMLARLVREAAAVLLMPTALVTVVLDTAQFLAAEWGAPDWMAEAGGTPIEWSFCVHSLDTRAPFVVEDATEHPLVHRNPLVSQDGVRSYAGAPMLSAGGHVLGNFCVLNTVPRRFSDHDIAVLAGFARVAAARLDGHR